MVTATYFSQRHPPTQSTASEKFDTRHKPHDARRSKLAGMRRRSRAIETPWCIRKDTSRPSARCTRFLGTLAMAASCQSVVALGMNDSNGRQANVCESTRVPRGTNTINADRIAHNRRPQRVRRPELDEQDKR